MCVLQGMEGLGDNQQYLGVAPDSVQEPYYVVPILGKYRVSHKQGKWLWILDNGAAICIKPLVLHAHINQYGKLFLWPYLTNFHPHFTHILSHFFPLPVLCPLSKQESLRRDFVIIPNLPFSLRSVLNLTKGLPFSLERKHRKNQKLLDSVWIVMSAQSWKETRTMFLLSSV